MSIQLETNRLKMDQAHQSMEKMKRKASVLEKTEQLKRLEDERKSIPTAIGPHRTARGVV